MQNSTPPFPKPGVPPSNLPVFEVGHVWHDVQFHLQRRTASAVEEMAVGLPLVSLNVVFLRLGGRGQFERGARKMALEVLRAAGPYLAVSRMQSAVAGTSPG